MMANLLRAAVLAVLLLAAAVVAIGAQGDHPGRAVAIAVALLLAFVPILAVETLVMHTVNRRTGGHPPRAPAGVAAPPTATATQLLRSWAGELMAFVTVFLWRQPFRSTAVGDVPPGTEALPGAGPQGARGVVLVHGYCCNRGLWNPWIERLRALGVPCIAVDLEPVFGEIDAYAPVIEAAVQRLSQATQRRPVVVAHSMGGLAVRAWSRASGQGAAERLHRIVTIGTPHHGTWIARLAHTANARQMRMDSPWIAALEAAESAADARLYTCFWSHTDNIVFPAASAALPGADNRHLPARGHVDLINDPAVFAEVVRRATEAPHA
jgi:triacylglycerol lipase